ncbi:MAG: glycosyltransferase family 39 protein [Elusimicrobiota bacterium]
MEKKEKIYLILILLLSITLRVIGLNWGLPNKYHTVTYHPDENTHLVNLQAMNPSKLNFSPLSERNPLAFGEGTFHLYLYAATLKILSITKWLTIVKSEEFYFKNTGEWRKFFLVGRVLSVIFGVLTVWVTYLVSKKFYGERVGLLSALFIGILPIHIVYSQYLLMNVPGVFWIVIAFVFFKNIIDKGEKKDYIFAGISTGLAISTRYSAGPLFLILILAHFLSKREKKSGLLILGLAIMMLSFLIGTPYAILDYANFLKGLQNPIHVAGISGFTFDITPVLSSFRESFGTILVAVCASGIIFSVVSSATIYGRLNCNRKKDDLLILAWVFILLVFFIRAGSSASPGRILPIVPFFVIFGARFIDFLWTKKTIVGKSAAAILFLTAMPFVIAFLQLRTEPDIRDISSEWIEKNIPPNSSIGLLVEPSWHSPGIVDRKYRHPEHINLPNYRFIPLAKNDWPSKCGYDELDKSSPDYLIVSDVEITRLGEIGFPDKLKKEYGYEEIKKFEKKFAIAGVSIKKQIPPMLFVPNDMYIFKSVKSVKK